VQVSPAANVVLSDNTPTFRWNAIATGNTYQIQIDDLATFASPNVNETTLQTTPTSYTTSVLPNGRYYWRVRAINAYGATGAWSLGRLVTIDAEVPTVPVMLAPVDGANSTNRMLTLSWQAVTGGTAYEIQLDSNPAFTQPIIPVAAALTYRTPTPLSRGTYYWSVRALDAAGNASEWSSAWSFTVVAGVTVQNDENTPVPTATATATMLMQVVEAETVTASGVWTAYDSPSASGGRYVYSNGSLDDVLTLSFSGTQVDVIYIQHPALGSFALEVDGTVMQTVSATSVEAVFGAKASVTDLAVGAHTLRIVPLSGTIAIDAFAVELPVATLEPTTTEVPTEVVPTETAVPTDVVPTETETPTEVVATDVVPTDVPTATPLPAQQILDVEVDVIQRAGVWTSYATDLASGGSYLYSSGSLSDTLTLTFNGTQIDVIYVQHPALGTFALEVDGSVNQIVNTYAAETVFGTRATIMVPTGQHTLRILPISGTVALDAFALDAQASVVVPTVEPTMVPPTEVVPTDIPPTATPEPTAVPLPVTLPVATSFDSLAGWTAVGTWALDPAGYTGSSVFVSSASRGQGHTLTLDTPVDLHAAFYPHLSFWMRGQVSTTDLISVDISTDGGQSWTLIDLSSRLTAEWTLVDLGLTPFVGQVVLLRFHLDATPPLPEGGASVGLWLDAVTVQEVPPAPVVEPPAEPTAVPES
jgi:uncharacterized protein (DUF1810 family)